MHVTAAAGAAELPRGGFGLKVALEPYRKEEKTTLGRGFCALPTPSASSAGSDSGLLLRAQASRA